MSDDGSPGGAAARTLRERSDGDDGPLVGQGARWGLLLAGEAALVVAYFWVTGATVTRLGYVLAPFVWMNAGIWAVLRVGVPDDPRPRRRLLAGTVAAGYVVLLLAVTGLVGLYSGDTVVFVDVGLPSPGWGPVVRYRGTMLYATLVPYRLAGYLALGFLLYAALLDTAGAALSGAFGLASCVSCGFSVVLSVLAGVTGGSAAAAGALYAASVEVSTAAYLLSLVLLLWRPGTGGG